MLDGKRGFVCGCWESTLDLGDEAMVNPLIAWGSSCANGDDSDGAQSKRVQRRSGMQSLSDTDGNCI